MVKTFTLQPPERKIRAIYVSSYIPRKCGIATYTKDLTNAINILNPIHLAEVLAINEFGEEREYPWEVKVKIKQDDLQSYLDAAKYVNQSSTEFLHLQHEFGLFGGSGGEYILSFVEHLKKPLIVTFHTVLENPNPTQLRIVKELSAKSVAIIVMVQVAARRLRRVYKVPKSKIVVIPHGVPDVPYGPTEPFKKLLGLPTDKIIMGSNNLLSRNKGLENAILAVKEVVKKFPNFIFLIIGETHPLVKKFEGESYREYLETLVKESGLEKNVSFINQYLSLDDLIHYLRAVDISITPYLDPSQTASGALSYAVGAGKVSISTPYLYAKEVLADGRGLLVPFKKVKPLSQALLKVVSEKKETEELRKRAYQYGRTMIWPNVALRHLDLYSIILEKAKKRRTKKK